MPDLFTLLDERRRCARILAMHRQWRSQKDPRYSYCVMLAAFFAVKHLKPRRRPSTMAHHTHPKD